ncbi:MAG: YlbF family regulator [Ignavibacteriales bacterium]|nr:YlbF family regulator [Ignavibacteriales bacterium]
MEKQIEYVADEFVRTIQATPVVIEYMEALEKVKSNEEITNLTEKYYLLSAEFQKKQSDDTLTQDEIAELRSLTSKIQNNELNIELAEKKNLLKIILLGCNASISNEISMDFAKLAAPSGCC